MKSKEEIQAIHDLLATIADSADIAHRLAHDSIFSMLLAENILSVLPVFCWILDHGKSFPEKLDKLKELLNTIGYTIVDNKLIKDGTLLINTKPHLN